MYGLYLFRKCLFLCRLLKLNFQTRFLSAIANHQDKPFAPVAKCNIRPFPADLGLMDKSDAKISCN